MKSDDAKLKGPLPIGKSQPATIKIEGENLMSNNWITPEEMQRKKARQKTLLYAGLLLATMILSAAVTILANQI